MARSTYLVLLVFIFHLGTFVRAQSQTRPAFEVTSVKPGDPDDGRVALEINPGGRLSTTNMNLKMLIEFAYDVRAFQISGGPDWLGSAKYNIEAKPGTPIQDDPNDEKARIMLQALLEDRFALKVHRETKELPVYELVVAKNGSKLRKSSADEKGPSCNISPRGRFTCQRLPISLFAADLARDLERTVVDRTGLTGRYDISLEWTPAVGQNDVPLDPNGPSIFTALQEQLGLKLESAKGSVDVLVIDHVEKPSEN